MRIFNWLFRKNEHLSKKELLKKNAVTKLNNLSRRLKEKNSDKKFFFIVKMFFAEFFNINYEFTYDELTKEIKSKKLKNEVREKIILLADSLTEVEFSNHHVPPSELRVLIKKTKEAIHEL